MNELNTVYHESGVWIANEIAHHTFETLRHYGEKSQPLNQQDKIAIINHTHHIIKIALGKGREQIANKEFFMVYHATRNIVDIIHHIMPIKEIFNCSSSELVSDTLPDHANAYDAELWNIRQYLFDVELLKNEPLFKSRISEMLRSIQFALHKEMEQEFNHFQNTGRFSAKQ